MKYMKYIRILSVLVLLTVFFSGCGVHHNVDRSPVTHAISKAELQSAVSEDAAGSDDSPLAEELPSPLNLLPRTLFQQANDFWTEYIIGGGVCYLYSYDADDHIVSYVVMLDIISSTLFADPFYIEAHDGQTIYQTRQDLQIRPSAICEVKWDKASDSLKVWEDAPLRPVVKTAFQVEKAGDHIGTVLTEWSCNGLVADPIIQSKAPHFFTNIITEITDRLLGADQINALRSLSYGIIDDVEHNGTISRWITYQDEQFTQNEDALKTPKDSFQNNYIYQNYAYDGMGLGGIHLEPNGTLSHEEHYVLLSCRFTGIDPQIAIHLNWKLDITLSFEK